MVKDQVSILYSYNGNKNPNIFKDKNLAIIIDDSFSMHEYRRNLYNTLKEADYYFEGNNQKFLS